jgi:hypothetical protein
LAEGVALKRFQAAARQRRIDVVKTNSAARALISLRIPAPALSEQTFKQRNPRSLA